MMMSELFYYISMHVVTILCDMCDVLDGVVEGDGYE